MESAYKFELKDSYVVRLDDFKKIHALLSSRIGDTEITAECADNVSRNFSSLKELLKYENLKVSRIVNLNFRARSKDWNKKAEIEFIDRWYFGGIRIEIKARDDVVTRLRTDILDLIAGLRPWYNAINRFDVFGVLCLLPIPFYLALLAWFVFFGSSETSESTPRMKALTYLLAIIISVVYLAIAYSIHRFRKIIFPHGIYALGQEVRRYEIQEKWRWGLLVSFVASLIAGFVLIFLQALL